MCLAIQGLDVDESGSIKVKPEYSRRDEFLRSQADWAFQSDKKSAEFFENLSVKGGKVLDHAGAQQTNPIFFAFRMKSKKCSSSDHYILWPHLLIPVYTPLQTLTKIQY